MPLQPSRPIPLRYLPVETVIQTKRDAAYHNFYQGAGYQLAMLNAALQLMQSRHRDAVCQALEVRLRSSLWITVDNDYPEKPTRRGILLDGGSTMCIPW
jgi:hypothetical protein